MKTALVLLLTLSGCSIFARQPPPASIVCPTVALALCDVTTPPVPEQLAADDAVDRLILALNQRNECAALNRAKLGCLRPGKEKP